MATRDIGMCGIGAVSGYGWGRETLWEGLLSGKPAASVVSGLGPELGGTGWVARVPDGGDPADGATRFARAMRAAAREAITDAGERGWRPGRRVGLLHATVLGEVDLFKEFYTLRGGRMTVREFLGLMPSTPVSTLMREYGFHGPAMNVSAMCASGNVGLLTALAWLDADIVDDIVLISTDLSATPENLLHLSRLGVVVTDAEPLDACRPFQLGGRGFTMAEASVAFVLSRRSDRPYAVPLGGAMSHDAHHVTSIDPSLDQVMACFEDALANAGIAGSDVRYFNAHGPGTAQCDRAETTALETLFPSDARVFSVKPLVGHCQGAASAVEVAVSALAYERGLIPAPRTVAPAHPQLVDGHERVTGGITVKSSLGMGGHNSVVVLAPPA
jgi:3-oxoacyl-[acyl-carrier-protein] synthase II